MNFRKHHSSPNGFATVLTLLGMLLVAVSLPIATKLVQQNQDNRSSAAIDGTYDDINGGHEPECDKNETKCINGFINTCNTSYRWVKTTQTCSDPNAIPGIPLCTKVTYGSWSECVNGKQTRTVTKEPGNCSGGVPVESNEQTCTITPTCTSFNPGDWGACNKFADGYFQTRTITAIPAGCTGGNPPNNRQSCTPVPVNPGGHEPECDKGETKCIDGFINTCNTSYRWVKTTQICSDPKVTPGVPLCTKVTYGSWSECVNGKQTRTVTKQPSNCSGGVTVLSNIQNCTVPVTCTYFTTTYWGACNKFADGYFQTRTVKGYPDGCTGGTPPPDKQSCCTSTDCGACGNPSACRSSGCYWETLMKVCTSKITENLPNPLCDGAMTGSKKCSNTTTLAKCGEKGWEFEYCNSWKSESCIDNKCQNINEYKKNFTSCTSSTFLGYKTYDTTSCPEGYSCDRELGICKPIEKLAAKKAAGSSCNTDADCLSGYCDSPHAGSVLASAGKVCGDSSDKEQITEDAKVAGIELAVVAALTTGGVITSVGGPTAAALMATNWMANNPNIMSKIQTASNIADIAEYISGTIACAVNPNSILCQNLADNMAVPGMSGLADSAADVIDAGVDAVVAANSAAKATDALVDVTKTSENITDGLVDTTKTTKKLSRDEQDVLDTAIKNVIDDSSRRNKLYIEAYSGKDTNIRYIPGSANSQNTTSNSLTSIGDLKGLYDYRPIKEALDDLPDPYDVFSEADELFKSAGSKTNSELLQGSAELITKKTGVPVVIEPFTSTGIQYGVLPNGDVYMKRGSSSISGLHCNRFGCTPEALAEIETTGTTNLIDLNKRSGSVILINELHQDDPGILATPFHELGHIIENEYVIPTYIPQAYLEGYYPNTEVISTLYGAKSGLVMANSDLETGLKMAQNQIELYNWILTGSIIP